MLSSCKKDEPVPQSPVIAEVGKTALTLDEAIAHIPKQMLAEDSLHAVENYRRQWIRKQIFVDEAIRIGIKETPEFQLQLEKLSSELAVQMMMENVLNSEIDVEISREEALNYYAENRENFILQERHIRFHHLFAATADEANRARNELMRGEPWQEIVERYAIDKMYSLRNSDQFHPVSQALSENQTMSQFLSVIGVTEVSPVRRVQDRYHFVQLLEDRKIGEPADIEWSVRQIQEWLTIENRQKTLRSFEQNLLRRAEANREIKIID